ncbi:hypothetical protein COO60DRAFT_1496327, partial [Scenedesmus sp. NREL 46B-D3]
MSLRWPCTTSLQTNACTKVLLLLMLLLLRQPAYLERANPQTGRTHCKLDVAARVQSGCQAAHSIHHTTTTEAAACTLDPYAAAQQAGGWAVRWDIRQVQWMQCLHQQTASTQPLYTQKMQSAAHVPNQTTARMKVCNNNLCIHSSTKN